MTYTSVRRWAMVSRTLKEFAKFFRKSNRPNVVVASGDCYVGLLGYLIARSSRAPFIFDVYDKYDEFPTYRRFGPFDPLKFLIKHADAVAFASHALVREVGSRARTAFVVPNGIDSSAFRAMDRNESRRRLGLPLDRQLVGYFGSMESFRGIDDLIEAVEIVRQSVVDLELVIAGRTHSEVNLDREWIRYLGNLPFERIPAALAACDVLAMPYRRSAFIDMASSCKIVEYIASHRPIVATRTPNLVENFPLQARELGELLAEPGNVAEIADSIQRQLAEPRLVSMPEEMEWASIAAYARSILQRVEAAWRQA